MRAARLLIACGVVAVLALAATPRVAAKTKNPPLQAGVARVDITPPTGYVLGGWTRADRVSEGVHTRLQASALVLKSGKRKLALVAVDLFMIAGGLVTHATQRAGHGLNERNVLISASHTHSGPGGFANFDRLNTVAPSAETTVTDPFTWADLLVPRPADRQLYTFLVDRIALALRRANADLRPAEAAWGTTRLFDVTENRSIEAHLADHGIIEDFGEGDASQDPKGYKHTLDPLVSVLRIDQRRGGRLVPVGAWTSFANHGNVNPSPFDIYNQDHHAAARLTLEAAIRRHARLPRRAPVVSVYGNADEGDQSAGLHGQGPLIAERAGRREGRAMFRAWKRAGRRLERRPSVDLRWTRVCFCGQMTSAGRVASEPIYGMPFLTGSEEERGPLYELTHVPFEGVRAPAESSESHGHKVGMPGTDATNFPTAVPLFVARVGDRLVISFPGEATAEVGRRARGAVLKASRGSGVRGVAISGLTNEYINYFTTPEEYDRQHYEGGSTFFGPATSVLLTEQLADLARRLRTGEPAPGPYPFDPTNGVKPDGAPYPKGANDGEFVGAPADVAPGDQAVVRWRGAPRGLDMPLDRRFITVQRRQGNRWKRVADDLGLSILWTVDDDGVYDAHWQVPRRARAGTYRVVISANRYRMASAPFEVRRGAPEAAPDPGHPASEFAPITAR